MSTHAFRCVDAEGTTKPTDGVCVKVVYIYIFNYIEYHGALHLSGQDTVGVMGGGSEQRGFICEDMRMCYFTGYHY